MNLKLYKIILSFLLVILSTTSCFRKPPEKITSDDSNKVFESALNSYNKGDYGLSIKQFSAFVQNYPKSPKIIEARLYLAKSYAGISDYDNAIREARIVSDADKTPFSDYADLSMGDWYLKQNKLFSSTGQYLKVMEKRKHPDAVSQAEARVKPLIDKLNYNELEVLSGNYSSNKFTPYMVLRMAQIRYNEKKFNDVVYLLIDFSTRFPKSEYVSQANKLLSEARTYPDTKPQNVITSQSTGNKIGVVLPLTGDYDIYGLNVKDGIQLAVEEYNRTSSSDRKLELIFYDSKGDALEAVKKTMELAKQDNVLCIIGPVTSNETISASVVANFMKVPIIAPTATKLGISSIGEYVFQMSVPIEKQISASVLYAIDNLGYTNFAILSPNNSYGEDLSQIFKREVNNKGGRIVVEREYPEEMTDFKDLLEDIKNSYSSEIDAIFLPGAPNEIVLIAPQLPFHGIHSKLIGTSVWSSKTVLKEGGKYVHGAIFSTDFWEDESYPVFERFQKQYKIRFGRDADRMATLGYDAASLVTDAYKNGANTRETLRTALSNTKNFEGASGIFSFNSDGELEKKMFIITINNGKLERLE